MGGGCSLKSKENLVDFGCHSRDEKTVQEELGTPALAFTRGVCEVLGLDSTVTEEVAILRRNLLRLIQVREFGDDAAFKVNPPPSPQPTPTLTLT